MTSYHPGRLMTVCGNVNMLWSAPLQMGIAVSMLWLALGPCVCGGLAVMLLLIPLQVLTSPLESLRLPWLHLLRLYLLWLHLRSAPTAEPHQMPIPRLLPSP